jgi:hypothetical protein
MVFLTLLSIYSTTLRYLSTKCIEINYFERDRHLDTITKDITKQLVVYHDPFEVGG